MKEEVYQLTAKGLIGQEAWDRVKAYSKLIGKNGIFINDDSGSFVTIFEGKPAALSRRQPSSQTGKREG